MCSRCALVAELWQDIGGLLWQSGWTLGISMPHSFWGLGTDVKWERQPKLGKEPLTTADSFNTTVNYYSTTVLLSHYVILSVLSR
jgi:hypothetical protein